MPACCVGSARQDAARRGDRRQPGKNAAEIHVFLSKGTERAGAQFAEGELVSRRQGGHQAPHNSRIKITMPAMKIPSTATQSHSSRRLRLSAHAGHSTTCNVLVKAPV